MERKTGRWRVWSGGGEWGGGGGGVGGGGIIKNGIDEMSD